MTFDVKGEGAQAIRLTVIDESGLLIGARSGSTPLAPDVLGRSAVVDVNDVGPELLVGWIAAPCAIESTLTLQPVDSALLVDVAVPGPAGCDLLGTAYAAHLDLRRPIGDRAVVVVQDDPDARSWGAAVLASDGRRRPLLVLDRSDKVESVVPVEPGTLDPGDGGVAVRPRSDRRSVVVSWAGDVCDDRGDVVVDLAATKISVRITLANESEVPCLGQSRYEGIAITFTGSVDPAAIQASLISRH